MIFIYNNISIFLVLSD